MLTNNTTPASYPYAVGHWPVTPLSQGSSELEQLVTLSGIVMNFIKSLTLNAIECVCVWLGTDSRGIQMLVCNSVYMCVCVLLLLGTDSRGIQMLGRNSTTEQHIWALRLSFSFF